MRVLITGGYGCIGAWIVRRLLEQEVPAFVYDLREDPRRLAQLLPEGDTRKAAFLQGDVTDLPRLKDAIGENGITHVIHLAGLQVPTCRADPILGAKVNVLGTLAVFEAVKAHQPQVKRLVYASSAAVFGPQSDYDGPRVADDVKLSPTTHYGHFKVCNEGNARVYFQDNGLTSIGLRPGTVYGVGRDFGMTSEPTKAVMSVALGRPFAISYGGMQDLQYADDVAGMFLRCAEAPYSGAKSYNVRGDVATMADFHAALGAVAPEARELVTFGDKQLAISYDLGDDALQRDLGPMPRTPLEEGLRRTLAQFRQLKEEGRLDSSCLG
ncbi:MAG: NAD(P)-dependent oxidoreductase [Gemmataceae bacterium]|nr:NAD(P)-dependent oxidoreductase [Gemmataceae bacterium]